MPASEDELTLQTVVDLINADDRINWAEAAINISLSGRLVVLSGKVGSIADKRRACNAALKVKGVEGVQDDLVVTAIPARTDKQIARHVIDALEQDPWIDHTKIKVTVKGGVVRLEGEAESLLRKRLIGVTAWWIPGVRNVINDLQVLYPEEDSDDQIVDACETVLEKDPFVDSTEVLVRVRDGVVTLIGSVCSEGEREIAESDCWYVLGVRDVINKLTVVPGAGMERPAS